MPITKEFKTFEQQVQGLEVRNLKFKNKMKSLEILRKYNYFDVINGFESILLNTGVSPKKYTDVYFEDFYDLFKFDMELKKQALFKIFDIESRLRTSIAYHFTKTHCCTISTTMNYINPCCYQAPNPSDAHLSKKFNNFDLFKSTKINKKTGYTDQSFIDSLKYRKDYVSQYTDPPFWVVIKSLPLGSLYYTYLFLDNTVKPLVLQDFGFSPAESNIFEQSINILKEMRNECAHIELVSRFKMKRDPKLNHFHDITIYAGLSKTQINYMDVVKVLRIFGDVTCIKRSIIRFYVMMSMKGRRRVAKKILGKMGNQNIIEWVKL